MTNIDQFSELSYKLTSLISNDIKKETGIYFTPNIIIDKCGSFVLDYMNENNLTITNILEPSCGGST